MDSDRSRQDAAGRRGAVAVGDFRRGVLVRIVERIAPADGIGAVLRYAPTLHAAAR